MALAQGPVQAQTGASALPQLGDGQDFGLGEERQLGDRIARELLHDPDYIEDPVLAAYVQGVWQPLLAAARLRGELPPELEDRFAWRVLLLRNRTVNAFALPGGYLGMHLGLLAVVGSRDELASVLGHELSHVTQRHIARLIGKSQRETPWVIGAMILGALAASHSAQGGTAVMAGSQALAAQSQLNFSRDMEREADRIGFGVMTQAGFAPEGFVTMFDKLQQAARLNDAGAYPYLRTHPLTTERIADIQSRLPLGAPHPLAPQPNALHSLMMTRAQVLANPGADAWRAWVLQAQDPALTAQGAGHQAGVLYGAALSASALHEPQQARAFARHLQSLAVAQEPAMAAQALWLQAEIDAADPSVLPASWAVWAPRLQATAEAPALAADLRPALYAWAVAALRSGQPAQRNAVIQRLQTWLVANPRDAWMWQVQAQLNQEQGLLLRALRAQAEVQVASLDLPAALDRLRAAQDLLRTGQVPNDSASQIDAAIIDARVRDVSAELRRQQARAGAKAAGVNIAGSVAWHD
jgi:predicted Zn-dependent protease